MRTIYLHLNIGYPGASQSDEIVVEDDTTDEEIDEIVREWANDYIDYGWSDEKPKRGW
jgi:hypothetical protein